MNRTTLLALASRVEAAAGADRELDCLIWAEQNGEQITWQGNCMVAGVHGVVGWIDPGVTQRNFSTNRATTGPASIPAYTASLDAAMSLAKDDERSELLNEAMESVSLNGWKDGEYLQELIRAFVAASLRAIAGSLTE